MASHPALIGLKRQRPEWAPWLAVVEEILREAKTPAWNAAVPAGAGAAAEAPGADTAAARGAVPILAGATLTLKEMPIRRLFERLIRIASRTGTAKMATLERTARADIEMLPLFAAALGQSDAGITAIAASSGADAEAFQAVVALLPIPLLHACNRRWASSMAAGWVEGYCPVCGSWPAFAEIRGIERSRFFRCGRCGGAWHSRALHCPYCHLTDHDELVALVPENSGSNAVIDACKRCLGYVKTFTRLQGCAPVAVMIDDLASVDLDVAALEQGYTRPSGSGYPLAVTVTEAGWARRLFAWRS